MLLLAKSISQHNNREQNVPECELILLFSSYFSSKLVVFLLYLQLFTINILKTEQLENLHMLHVGKRWLSTENILFERNFVLH